MRRFWLVLGLAVGCTPAYALVGTVTHVRDGDTIVVGDIPIRLQGMTCNELGNPLGDAAADFMEGLVGGRQVYCSLTGRKTFDRREGRCETQGQDIAAITIETGICGRCPAFDRDGQYTAAEITAGPFTGVMPDYCKD